MKPSIAPSVLSALALASLLAPVAAQDYAIDPDRYGALVYSPKT